MLEIRTEPLHPNDWLPVIEREYFKDFLRAGGAAAKFVIGDEAAQEEIQSECAVLARRHGLLHAHLSAGETKLHMAQEMFFALARVLPWEGLLQRYLEDLFTRHEHPWPRPGTAMSTAELADAFGIAPGIMTRHRDQWLSRDLWDDPRLARDFRSAMIALCLSRLDPQDSAGVAETPVHQWLRGEKPPLSTLRGFDITTQINRPNARAMLISLCHFLRKAGASGLLLTIDLRPAIRKTDSGVRYSPSAVMDLYEVLRELIDDLEHLPGLFILGVADQGLIAGDRRRTLDTYKALEMRIWPDVRPGDRQNPLAPLVMVAL
jgi:bacteriophage exclusion system BrxC/D-like protein